MASDLSPQAELQAQLRSSALSRNLSRDTSCSTYVTDVLTKKLLIFGLLSHVRQRAQGGSKTFPKSGAKNSRAGATRTATRQLALTYRTNEVTTDRARGLEDGAMSFKDCGERETTVGVQCRCGAPSYPHGTEADRLEQQFWAIKRECQGHPIRTLRAMPRTMRVLRDLFGAYLKEAQR